MRLLGAELRKLARPLSWGVAGAAALFCVLLAVGGAHNAALAAHTPAGHLPTCAELRLTGSRCAQAMAAERARLRQFTAQPAQVAAQLSPLAAGAEAAGLMASLPGALALALLAGAHIGGEWSGRTLKNVLIQRGRRWQVLAAKLVSLWLAGAALIAVCWAALAIAGPALIRLNHLPAAHQSAAHALGLAAAQAGRALLVLAVFAVIGLLAAVLTRGTIGTTAAAAGAVIALLVAGDPARSGPVDAGHLGAGLDGVPGRPGVDHHAAQQLLVPVHQRQRPARSPGRADRAGRPAGGLRAGGGGGVPPLGHQRMTRPRWN